LSGESARALGDPSNKLRITGENEMNSSQAIFIACALGAASNSFASPAPQPADARAYQYGMQLDIAKVLSTDISHSTQCEVVEAKMAYLNSAGGVQVLRYLTLSSACSLD
jgi:hypothetical protein